MIANQAILYQLNKFIQSYIIENTQIFHLENKIV